MKRVAVFLILTIVMVMMSGLAQAGTMTLDDCIQLALEKRASIIQARGAEGSAAAGKRAALGAFLPNIRASYSYSKGKQTNINPPDIQVTQYTDAFDTTAIDGDTVRDAIRVPVEWETITSQDQGPSKSWAATADMDIFNAANWFQYAAAGAAKAGAKLDVLASEQDLITSVKVSYYAHLAAVQNVTVQEEAVKRAAEQLKLIESRFELGSASKSDVLRQKVQYGNDQLAMLSATNAVTDTRANLAYTIGIDPREDLQFETVPIGRQYEGTLDEAIGFGIEHNPRLLSSEKTTDQARHSLRAAKSTYLPTLSASADYRKFNGTQSFTNSTLQYSNRSYSYGFSIGYSIFDGFLREKRVTDAKVFRNNAMASLADTRNSVVAGIKSSYLKIEQLKKQQEVSTENVTAAEEDYRITKEKYNLGAATILDLLDSQVTLKGAQVALINVQFDLNLAIAQLEYAMGKM